MDTTSSCRCPWGRKFLCCKQLNMKTASYFIGTWRLFKKKVAYAGHNLHFYAQPIYLAFSERFMSLCARAVFEKFRSDFITSEYYLATRGTSSRRQSKLVQLRQRAPAFWCKIPATQSRARFCPQSSFSLATAAAVCASMPPAPTPDTKPAERMRCEKKTLPEQRTNLPVCPVFRRRWADLCCSSPRAADTPPDTSGCSTIS